MWLASTDTKFPPIPFIMGENMANARKP